jgi:hypothetical protein
MSSQVDRGERRVHLATMISRESTTYIWGAEVRKKKKKKKKRLASADGDRVGMDHGTPCHGERVALVFITTFSTVQAAHGREAYERPTERSWVYTDWPALPIEDTS